MQRPMLLLGFLLLMLNGCQQSNEENIEKALSPSNVQITLEEVVESLDSHTLVAGDEKPYYQMIGAYDGMKYTVNGDYLLEVYIYKNGSKDLMESTKAQLETADTPVVIDGEILFLFHTSDSEKMKSLLDDFSE